MCAYQNQIVCIVLVLVLVVVLVVHEIKGARCICVGKEACGGVQIGARDSI
jgi:hypothetical protein